MSITETGATGVSYVWAAARASDRLAADVGWPEGRMHSLQIS